MTYIEAIYQPVDPKRKTRKWSINSIAGGKPLGIVTWYAPWRRYVFAPVSGTVFEATCLHELADFCRFETTKRKAERCSERVLEKFGPMGDE